VDTVTAAENYAIEAFGLDEEDDDDDDEGGPFADISWRDAGYYREECSDANNCNDRVHIEDHSVS
jgi:hypothetical protein